MFKWSMSVVSCTYPAAGAVYLGGLGHGHLPHGTVIFATVTANFRILQLSLVVSC